MKRSSARIFVIRYAELATLVAVDLGARLAVPVSLVALARGQADAALIAAVVVSLLAVVRGLLNGAVAARCLERVWRQLVEATRRYDVSALRDRSVDKGIIVLVNASFQVSTSEAAVLPRALADALGLLIVAAVVLGTLDAEWLLVGAVLFVFVGALVAIFQQRMRREEQRSWGQFGATAHDFSALVEAGAELRVHGREDDFAAGLHRRVRALAAVRQKVSTYSAVLGLLPFGIALVAASAPLRARLVWVGGQLGVERFAELGVVGATAIVFGLGLMRSIEAWVRADPQRQTLDDYLTAVSGARHSNEASADAVSGDIGALDIVFEDVAIRYPGATVWTPGGMNYRWAAGRGLALVGANGSGKSSISLALLGLIQPTEGTICVGDRAIHELATGWGGRVVYLPQRPYLDPGSTVGWHLRLLGEGDLDEAALTKALQRVGLYEPLKQHGERTDTAPLAVLAGELSGGERARLHFARVFLPRARPDGALIVLDEPEAGLDAAGRSELRGWLTALAETSRVLLIAHDHEVIPEPFERLTCHRQPGDRMGEKPNT